MSSPACLLFNGFRSMQCTPHVMLCIAKHLSYCTLQDDAEKARRMLERRLADAKKLPGRFPQLQHLCNGHVKPMSLYGQQDPKLVDEAICKGRPGERRVIFCTNVAETSLTIDGVTVVVDAGFNKEALYDHQKHMTILQVTINIPC